MRDPIHAGKHGVRFNGDHNAPPGRLPGLSDGHREP